MLEMKFALVSDLHVDRYPDNQPLDWLVVRTWSGTGTLVIVGNVSDCLQRTMREILMARRAFDTVIFVEGPCEYDGGHLIAETVEQLRSFAERHDGIHYLGTGPGIVIDQTLVCGIATRSHLDMRVVDGGQGRDDRSVDHVVLLAQRVRDAAADPHIREVMIVTHMAPHADAIAFTDDPLRDLEREAACTAALTPIWSDCLDGGKLTTWCFGHSRLYQDFTDEGVRFISNPRGYRGNLGDNPYTVRVVDTSTLTDEGFGGSRQVYG
ncbi:hypothetical protein N825_29465 [Skermanella stibiiresistens SB22]|uniref:Calcineurin-like phosphoesterase domain-containing protein n=2 Tax=Skermanella TaxID=204447 RepID=W9GU68_9PROT|nr:hypothetical protein N825_29465 [Skermanella stibiiresistens SB22]